MKTPDRNYLAAYAKNLIRAGDTLAFLAGNLSKGIFAAHGGDKDLDDAICDWKQAKENLMGLAGRKPGQVQCAKCGIMGRPDQLTEAGPGRLLCAVCLAEETENAFFEGKTAEVPEGKLDADAEDQARRQGKAAFDAEMAAL